MAPTLADKDNVIGGHSRNRGQPDHTEDRRQAGNSHAGEAANAPEEPRSVDIGEVGVL